jgi:hypothetical protein
MVPICSAASPDQKFLVERGPVGLVGLAERLVHGSLTALPYGLKVLELQPPLRLLIPPLECQSLDAVRGSHVLAGQHPLDRLI